MSPRINAGTPGLSQFAACHDMQLDERFDVLLAAAVVSREKRT